MAYKTKEEHNKYISVHMWVRYHFGKPKKCENCKTTEDRMYHWANISRTYKRERSDWLRLCVPCHKSNDIKALGGKIQSRPKMVQPTKICAECNKEFSKNPRLSKKQWESTLRCGKACSAKYSGRIRKGIKQSEETKRLKSAKLKERWATNQQWRDYMTERMKGNKYAIGKR